MLFCACHFRIAMVIFVPNMNLSSFAKDLWSVSHVALAARWCVAVHRRRPQWQLPSSTAAAPFFSGFHT